MGGSRCAGALGCIHVRVSLRADGAMKNLNARAWLVLGAGPESRHDAISDMAALGRGTLPRQESARICRIPETGPTSSCAIRVVVEAVA